MAKPRDIGLYWVLMTVLDNESNCQWHNFLVHIFLLKHSNYHAVHIRAVVQADVTAYLPEQTTPVYKGEYLV